MIPAEQKPASLRWSAHNHLLQSDPSILPHVSFFCRPRADAKPEREPEPVNVGPFPLSSELIQAVYDAHDDATDSVGKHSAAMLAALGVCNDSIVESAVSNASRPLRHCARTPLETDLVRRMSQQHCSGP